MNVISNFKEARVMRVKTPEDIQMEMETPDAANFAQFDYHFPNGVICGVGKSKRPSHASLFQLIVTDFNGKTAVKFPSEYAGEYTSTTRAEKSLNLYCKDAWDHAEALKTKQTRETEAAKQVEAAEKLAAEMDAEIVEAEATGNAEPVEA